MVDIGIKPGVMSAFVTPFDENGKVKVSAIKEIVDFQLERGLQGIYVCGSTGEGMAMSEDERMLVAEAVTKAAAGRAQVVVHVGATDTATAVRLAKHAASVGATGLSSVPPYYYKHHKVYVEDYYREVASATNLPFLAYHVPVLGAGISFDSLLALMDIPNIVGMKYTEDNLEVLYKFKEKKPDCICFMGHDAMLLSALVLGANGGIGAFYNVMPQGFANVYKYFADGDLSAAMNEQLRIDHYITLMKKYMLTANQIPIKAVLKSFGVDAGIPRKPVRQIEPDAYAALVSELRKDGFYEIYK